MTLEVAAALPAWAEKLRHHYLSGTTIQFLLHNNVRDLVAWRGEYLRLDKFLYEALLKQTKDVVVYYDISEGLTFAVPQMKEKFLTALNVRHNILGLPPVPAELPRDARRALPLLEAFLSIPGQRVAVVIDFVEALVPANDPAMLGGDDRTSLITLERWANEPHLLASDNIIILIGENVAEINKAIVRSPQIQPIDLSLPGENERLAFLRKTAQQLAARLEAPEEAIARLSSGLRLIQLEGVLRQSAKSGEAVSISMLAAKRKEIIENECFGLVEMIDPDHGLDVVGGMEVVKGQLARVAEAIKNGVRRHVPMGIFFVGPMGTGKTYVAEAFARDSGLTCLALKNFRDKWVGSTEGNLEKILNIVRALGSVMIIIDEVDRALGGEDGDSGVSSRVFARIKAFMSDTSHRGKILWLVMSNRPDKLDIDLKRPGRFDRKIPFFFPQSAAERQLIFEAQVRKHRIDREPFPWEQACARTDGYSAAEIEALLLLADEFAAERSRKMTEEDLLDAIADFVPNRNRKMIDFMELLAVFECSSRRLLPERFKAMTDEELGSKLSALRAELRL
ncbi:MAG: ATP-binding protein [Candidatus Sericytochromatia bacterium]|nr:ATP-binding protein [Candidatus Tanganyikabacteria bacterium]